MIIKLLTEYHLEFLSLKEAAEASPSLLLLLSFADTFQNQRFQKLNIGIISFQVWVQTTCICKCYQEKTKVAAQ